MFSSSSTRPQLCLPFRPCYSEIEERLAPTAQAATVFSCWLASVAFTVVLNSCLVAVKNLNGEPHNQGVPRQGDLRFEPITPGGVRIAVIAVPSDIRGPGIETVNGDERAIKRNIAHRRCGPNHWRPEYARR